MTRFAALSGLIAYFLLFFVWAAENKSAQPLGLDEVNRHLEKTFPVILLATREIRKAEFDILSAQGAFDIAIKGAAANTTGYYNTNRLEMNAEKPTTLWGTSFYAGYRVSQGDFPDYYGARRTNPAGEIRFGGRIPLWRDRSVDQGRLDLQQSQINKAIAGNVLDEQRLAVYRDAAVSYWTWVAAGQRRRIVGDLLENALLRKGQIKKRVALGDIPAIEEKENDRAILARREQIAAAERLLQKSGLYLSLYFRDADGKMIRPSENRLPSSFPAGVEITEQQFRSDCEAALTARPELKRIQLEIELEQNSLRFHENQRSPQIDLIVGGSRDINGGAVKRDPWEAEFGVVFNIPLQTRKQDGKIGGTETKIEILRQKYRFLQDKISLEARDALIALDNALRRLEIIRQELAVAENLARAEKTRFDLGESTLLIVNLREQAAAEVALRLVGAEADYWIAQADYRAALMKTPAL